MTFTTKAVPVAMLLALAIPTFVHAAPKADLSATMANLVIEAGNQQSSTSLATFCLTGRGIPVTTQRPVGHNTGSAHPPSHARVPMTEPASRRTFRSREEGPHEQNLHLFA